MVPHVWVPDTTVAGTYCYGVKAAAPTVSFTDVASDAWYVDEIAYAVEHGIMEGVGNNQFNPEGSITRAQLVQILYNIEGRPTVTGTNNFTDVSSSAWYADAVQWAYENKIVEGTGGTTFAPNSVANRQTVATILYRYTADYKKLDVSKSSDLASFTDKSEISSWALEGMQWANGYKIINGVTTTQLKPTGTTTRAQMATMMMNYCENIAS